MIELIKKIKGKINLTTLALVLFGFVILLPVFVNIFSGQRESFLLKELTLNNGSKWRADELTRKNMEEMQINVKNLLKKESHSSEEYTNAALLLEKNINEITEKSILEGQAREELYKILYKIMLEVKPLKKGLSDPKKEYIKSVYDKIEIFYEYFE
ncbi:MAG: hypothetical protein OEZ22_14160 [Spirochaetia bacterium]|nr:hypothetical protein [Spirochaetia bacterium]